MFKILNGYTNIDINIFFSVKEEKVVVLDLKSKIDIPKKGGVHLDK